VEETRVDGKLVGWVIHFTDEQGQVERHYYTADRKLIRVEAATG
jgi:YD repeat-containing protein